MIHCAKMRKVRMFRPLLPSFPGRDEGATRNLEIPGSMLRIAPE
jgi:hypothetical protein